jgi:hypothetical protein
MSICPFLILWWYWPVTVAADVVAVGTRANRPNPGWLLNQGLGLPEVWHPLTPL